MLRGFHSKSRSSTASSTAATGEAKVADMPAAAPATRSVFRSAAVSSKNWATRDPKAPPVMMIGPSAPNRSEEHTSELQSLTNLVCRLLLEKKKKQHCKQ